MDKPCNNAPDWVNWIAQDADGTWWGYKAEPLESHIGWYENEIDKYIRLDTEKPNIEWRNTLTKYRLN